jgi:hypothetical protein
MKGIYLSREAHSTLTAELASLAQAIADNPNQPIHGPDWTRRNFILGILQDSELHHPGNSHHELEEIVRVDSIEDGGKSITCQAFSIETLNSDEENGMSIRLQSWDEDTDHVDMRNLLNKKVKITIEVYE